MALNETKVELHPSLGTPVARIDNRATNRGITTMGIATDGGTGGGAMAGLKRLFGKSDTPGQPKDRQAHMRFIYETPGVVVIDNALDDDLIDALRIGLSDKARKFKDKFNEGVDAEVGKATVRAVEEITKHAKEVFGYDLPPSSDHSYRPMISAEEPMHFDTYHVECGMMPLMAILNFAPDERKWHVGPNFIEACEKYKKDTIRLLQNLKEGESPSVPMRVAGVKGDGPLGDHNLVHKIEFAPNTLWFANPKIISHQLVYGRGCVINTWLVPDPSLNSQKAIMERTGVLEKVNYTPPQPAAA